MILDYLVCDVVLYFCYRIQTPTRTLTLPQGAKMASQSDRNRTSKGPDPIILTLFANRFMSVAEAMGRSLQQTSISTNIKERLDFSCALFAPDGDLVANAPFIPIHLGSMSLWIVDLSRYMWDEYWFDFLVPNVAQWSIKWSFMEKILSLAMCSWPTLHTQGDRKPSRHIIL